MKAVAIVVEEQIEAELDEEQMDCWVRGQEEQRDCWNRGQAKGIGQEFVEPEEQHAGVY